MIANLKIVVKTFAKITKTLFAGLSATIMDTGRALRERRDKQS